jgi:hypothetical protein
MPGRIVVCALLAAGVLWSAAESGLSAPVVNTLSAQPGSVDLSFDFGNGDYNSIRAITAARDGKPSDSGRPATPETTVKVAAVDPTNGADARSLAPIPPGAGKSDGRNN